MTIRDWASLATTLIGALGWYLTWKNSRETHKKLREKEIEQRGISGYKFRLMYRTLAPKYNWPVNGEDTD